MSKRLMLKIELDRWCQCPAPMNVSFSVVDRQVARPWIVVCNTCKAQVDFTSADVDFKSTVIADPATTPKPKLSITDAPPVVFSREVTPFDRELVKKYGILL